ncbi:DUF4435 domain-containing protein [Aeromonas lacus]
MSDELLNSRAKNMLCAARGTGAALMTFTRILNNPKGKNKFFFFMEGVDDLEYYQHAVNKVISSDNWVHITCDGRKNVIEIIDVLSRHDTIEYRKSLFFGFIDNDYLGLNIKFPSRLYKTPCYAIENLYATTEFMENVLIKKFYLSPDNSDNQDYYNCLKGFHAARESFCTIIEDLDCYILSALIEYENGTKKHELNLANIKLKKFISVSTNNSALIKEDKFWYLQALNSKASHIQQSTFNETKKLYSSSPKKHMIIRGKFILFFINSFIVKLIEENKNNKESQLFNDSISDKVGFKTTRLSLNGSDEDFLSKLSVYAKHPDCLIKFLHDARKIADKETATNS